jgi:hypothetical protein
LETIYCSFDFFNLIGLLNEKLAIRRLQSLRQSNVKKILDEEKGFARHAVVLILDSAMRDHAR